MKVIVSENKIKKLVMTRREWENIGKKSNWLKTSELQNITHNGVTFVKGQKYLDPSG